MQNKNVHKKKSQGKSFGKYIKFMWFGYLFFLLAIIAFFSMLSVGWLGFMPTFEELENPKANLATEVYADNGELLGYIGIQNRSIVNYKDISPNLINALIATEDVRFREHSGIDARSLFRVLTKTLIGGKKSSGGGSTLSQQLAKNLFPREKKTFFGTVYSKLKEWIVAVKLERNYSKDEILSMYLNIVDYGSNAFGIKAAAHTFFSKLPSELSVEESAVLVGLLKAPTTYNPVRNPENSTNRRNTVLTQMEKYGFITAEELEAKKAQPIKLKYTPHTHDEGIATYFREMLRNYMKEWCKTHYKPNGDQYDVHKDGLKVYTTINYKMQKNAEDAVKEHFKYLQGEFFKHTKGYKDAPFTGISKADIEKYYLQAMKNSDRYRVLKEEGLSDKEIRSNFDKKAKMRVFTWNGDKDTTMTPWDSLRYYKHFLNTGMVSVEPQTGHVKVYVGGINYKHFKFDNAKLGRRQVGSTIKPFLYTLAMSEGFWPCDSVLNDEITLEDRSTGKKWTPRDSHTKTKGQMKTIRWGLQVSSNWITAYLMSVFTPEQMVKMMRSFGITSPITPVISLCLGPCEINLQEMVSSYTTFTNKGIRMEPMYVTRIEDNNGKVLATFAPVSHEVINEETTYKMLDMLKGVMDGGTGGRVRHRYGFRAPAGGKTGTSQNNSDGWFIGFTPSLVSGAWVGGEDRSIHFDRTAIGQGANTALPIWAYYMKKVYADETLGYDSKENFDVPKWFKANRGCW